MRVLIGLISAVSIALAASAAKAEEGVTDTEIIVGGILPYTGPAGILGYAGLLGTRLAAAEINDNGGINGRKIKVVFEDDEYVPAKTAQAMQKLIDAAHVFSMNAISGGSHGLAIMPLLDENAIPTINPLVTTLAHFEPARKTVFGIGLSYQDGARELVKFIENKHGPQKWVSAAQDDESGAAREEGLKAFLAESGRKPILMQRYKRDQSDFSAEVLKAKQAGATAILLGGLPSAHAAILKEAKKIGFAPVFGTTWVDHIPPAIKLYGAEGDGLYVFDFVPSMTDPKMAAFNELVKKYLPIEDQAKVNRYAVTSYAALKLQAAVIQACGKQPTRACVVDNIEKTQNFDSKVLPPLSFGKGVRLTKIQGSVLRIDHAAGKFVPAQ
jgi:branched-chain amino acid transport system substrate-binding protein